MRKIKYITILILLLSAEALRAELKIFIIPKVNKKGDELRLGDIARIDTMPVYKDEAGRLSKIVIENSLYADGFIDRNEIAKLLRKHTNYLYFIFGSAARIAESKGEGGNTFNIDEKNPVMVKKGDPVKLVVIKKGIRIEVHGAAALDGQKGDIIPVIINGGKRIRGKVIDKNSVEINLW